MATVYHRDQLGAPTLTYSTAVGSVAQFAALKTILKSCLVSGYGSEAAAGWELISEGDNNLVLRSGSRSGYVCFSHLNGTITVYLAETYTGMNGDVMQGGGLKSGTGAGNTPPHRISCYQIVYHPNTTTWSMVADAKTFILSFASVGSSNAASFDSGHSSFVNATLYVGEDSSGNFIAVGGHNTTATAATGIASFFDASVGFTALRNPATGLLVDSGSLAASSPGLASSSIQEPIAVVLPEVELFHVAWIGAGVVAGKLRGIAMPGSLTRCQLGWAAKALGFPVNLNTRNISNPLSLGDGCNYLVSAKYHQSMFFLLTDNPEFW